MAAPALRPKKKKKKKKKKSAPSERRSRFDVVGRLVALGHDAVTNDLAIAREQLPDLLQRLLVVAPSCPDPARVPRPWRYHLLRADLIEATPSQVRGRARADRNGSRSRGRMNSISSAVSRSSAAQPGPRNASVASAPVGNFASSSAPRGSVAGEKARQLLQSRVVADHHHRPDGRRNLVEACEQIGGPRTVELGFDAYRASSECRLDALECLPRAPRRGAQHQLGLDALLAKVTADRLGRTPAPARERAIVIGEPRLLPARLRVTQEIEAPLGHAHDCTRGRWPDRPDPRRWRSYGLLNVVCRRDRGAGQSV